MSLILLTLIQVTVCNENIYGLKKLCALGNRVQVTKDVARSALECGTFEFKDKTVTLFYVKELKVEISIIHNFS